MFLVPHTAKYLWEYLCTYVFIDLSECLCTLLKSIHLWLGDIVRPGTSRCSVDISVTQMMELFMIAYGVTEATLGSMKDSHSLWSNPHTAHTHTHTHFLLLKYLISQSEDGPNFSSCFGFGLHHRTISPSHLAAERVCVCARHHSDWSVIETPRCLKAP